MDSTNSPPNMLQAVIAKQDGVPPASTERERLIKLSNLPSNELQSDEKMREAAANLLLLAMIPPAKTREPSLKQSRIKTGKVVPDDFFTMMENWCKTSFGEKERRKIRAECPPHLAFEAYYDFVEATAVQIQKAARAILAFPRTCGLIFPPMLDHLEKQATDPSFPSETIIGSSDTSRVVRFQSSSHVSTPSVVLREGTPAIGVRAEPSEKAEKSLQDFSGLIEDMLKNAPEVAKIFGRTGNQIGKPQLDINEESTEISPPQLTPVTPDSSSFSKISRDLAKSPFGAPQEQVDLSIYKAWIDKNPPKPFPVFPVLAESSSGVWTVQDATQVLPETPLGLAIRSSIKRPHLNPYELSGPVTRKWRPRKSKYVDSTQTQNIFKDASTRHIWGYIPGYPQDPLIGNDSIPPAQGPMTSQVWPYNMRFSRPVLPPTTPVPIPGETSGEVEDALPSDFGAPIPKPSKDNTE